MSTRYGFTLAVCAEMVFLEKPIEERVALIHDLGFAVEIWDWTTKDLDALAGTGARFTSMTGYVEGNLTDPEWRRRVAAHRRTVHRRGGQAGRPEPEPARHRSRRERPARATGRDRD